MSTLSGFRRRGYTPASIRNFCDMIGVNRAGGVVDIGMLEFAIREDLTPTPRVPCACSSRSRWSSPTTRRIRSRTSELPRHPKQDMGVRVLPFSREVYIDAGDFEGSPPAGFKRLVPGGEVRLRGSYVIRADEAVKDDQGNIVELRCSYDENTLGKNPRAAKSKV